MQNRRVQIMNMHDILHGFKSEFIGAAVHGAEVEAGDAELVE